VSRCVGVVREFQMHALKAQAVFAEGIYWPRVLDLAWMLTANFAIWILIIKAPAVLGLIA
jgi:hypothetical protein